MAASFESGTLAPRKSANPSDTGFEAPAASVNALIRDFASVLKAAAGCAVELRLGLPDSIDRIRIDGTQFKVALLNLVASPEAGARAEEVLAISTALVDHRVSAAPTLEPGLYAAVCISHGGCDSAARALAPVLDERESRRDGLGLSQVYGFAVQSRGGVRVDTEEGKGTRVTIYLPLMAPADDTSPGSGPGAGSDLPTVLVVDDDEHVRGSTSDAIEMLGYRVIAEASVADALERVRSEPDIDILFTDIVLARGTSGVALAREARTLRPKLRVLLSSGHARETLGADGGGDFAFLAKPYRLQELGAALRALGSADS